MSARRPLEGRYAVMLTIALLALVPFIVVTTAYVLYRQQVQADLHADRTGLEIVSGIATAGYAFGALLGGDLIQRFRQRYLFLACEALFVAGCILAATAGGIITYGSGRVLFGFATGLLLVIALPPVIQQFPASKMPITAAAINIGFFGAVCAGPLIGGAVALGHAWRGFYGALAGAGALSILLAFHTLPDREPPNPGLPFDGLAIALALPAAVLPFWATSELSGPGFNSYFFTVLLSVGLVCLVVLLLTQYHKKEPLSPVKPMWSTLPVVGTLAAMVGGGAFVTFLELAETFELQVLHRPPVEAGILFWPQVLGVLIAAVLLGKLIASRWLPVLVLAGFLALIGGGALLLALSPHGSPVVLLAAVGLLGFGAGATVSPGLYLASFSLPSKLIGRIFALVELVRSEADFVLAPVLLAIARLDSGGKSLSAAGVLSAVEITLWITIGLTVCGAALYLAGAPGLPRPDLKGWLAGSNPAIESPALGAAFRPMQVQDGVPWPRGWRPDQVPVHAHGELAIPAPPERVWAWLVRAELWPDWHSRFRAVRILDGGGPELRPGARFVWSTPGSSFESLVRDYAEGERIGWTAIGTGIGLYQVWRIDKREDGCCVRVEETQKGWVARMQASLAPGRLRRQHQALLRSLAARARSAMPPGAP